MPASGSQVLSDHFFHEGKIDYQAVIQYSRAFMSFLSAREYAVYSFVIDATARFRRVSSYLALRQFFSGIDITDRCAGVCPVPHMSEQALRRILRKLERIGLMQRDGKKFTLLFEATPESVAHDEEVQRTVTSLNYRGGELSTDDGVIECGKRLTRWLVGLFTRQEPEQEEAQQNKGDEETESYTFRSKTQHSSPNKLGDIWERLMSDKDRLLHSITARVENDRGRTREKRAKRRTIGDQTNLFVQEWERGQRDNPKYSAPARLVSRDRKLLKDQIIHPFQNGNSKPEDFAYWVAKNWDAIGAQYFSKSKKYPEYPAFRWLVACLETYLVAYEQRDYLDETATMDRTAAARQSSAAKQAIEDAKQYRASTDEEVEDLRRQLREQDKEMSKLRAEKGMEPDDDPVYNRVIKTASKRPTIGSFDEPEPRKRPKRRKRK